MNSRLLCLLILGLLATVGCRNKVATDSGEEDVKSAQQESSIEQDSSSGVSSEVAQDAIDPWQDAILSVANKQSRSIAMNQPISVDKLSELATAGEAAELLLDQGVVSDADLTTIVTHLPNIEHLRIRLSPITDVGAEALTSLSLLRVLNLPQSNIGAKGIQSWGKLPNLEHIRLGGSQLDDSAMEALAALPNLQSLHLIGPVITDTGLQSLSKANKLSSLYIDDCQLSDAAWQQLKSSRPDLHIHLDQKHRDRLK